MTVSRIIKKYSIILSQHQKIRIIELVVLMLAGGMFETCSVTLMLPFMNAVMEPESAMEKPFIKVICSIAGIHSAQTLVVFIAIMLAAVYLIKNIYLLFEYEIQYRFVYGNMLLLQRKLLNSYLHRPYEYFLKAKSGEIIRGIMNDTSGVFSLLVTLLGMFTELTVSGMIIIAVFYMAPVITVSMAVILVILLLIINLIVKPVLHKAGENYKSSYAEMNKWLLQSVQGIKEVKVMAKEQYFQSQFDKYGKVNVDSLRKNQILSVAPRFIIESLSMGAILFIIAFLVYNGTDLEAAIPVLSAAVMAAIRLLPSVNRISSAMTSISYSEPMLDSLIHILKEENEEKTHLHSEKDCEIDLRTEKKRILRIQKALEFQNISYTYPSSQEPVLSKVSMKIYRGDSVGIVGASGAGKTTAVDIILGLLQPQEGRILIDGVDIRNNKKDWLNQIGYIPQMIFMLDDSIRANVAFGVPEKEIKDEEVWRALKEASMDDFVKSLPEMLDTQLGERGVRFSGGQRQRIGIARALYVNPEVLIFDEATSALDIETENAIMDSIHCLRGKKTMIIIAHRLSTIEGCDMIYRVEDKKIIHEDNFNGRRAWHTD